jgi:hypothetical protein
MEYNLMISRPAGATASSAERTTKAHGITPRLNSSHISVVLTGSDACVHHKLRIFLHDA